MSLTTTVRKNVSTLHKTLTAALFAQNLQSAPFLSLASFTDPFPEPAATLHQQTVLSALSQSCQPTEMPARLTFLPSIPLSTSSHTSLPSPRHRSPRPHLRLPPLRSSVASPPPLHNPSDHEQAVSSLLPPIKGFSALNAALSPSSYTSADTLIVVMFHARWCRVCKTLAHKISRIAPTYTDVIWLSVDFAEMENKGLCRDLGVRFLPTFRFYRPGMAPNDRPLEDFTSGPFGVKRVQERLKPYCARSPC